MRWHQVANRTAIAVTTMLLLSGCTGAGATPPAGSVTPSTSVPQPALTPQPDTTPIPTPAAPSKAPGLAGLTVRLTWNSDVVMPIAGTTVLDDGRVIWTRGEGIVERRLTDEGLAWVRAQLDETGPLASNRSHEATLVPGASPDPRGVTEYLFKLERDGARVKVFSGDPDDYQPVDAWVVPPEMGVLASLAKKLQDPESWIDPALWAEPAKPFEPQAYLVLLDLGAGPPGQGRYPDDVSDVAWPFATSIDKAGAPVLQGSSPTDDARCLVIDAATAKAMADAEAEVGRPRDLKAWEADGAYRWDAGAGNIRVETRQVLPYQSRTCADALAW